MEALWGVLLSCADPRAQTLIADIAQDSLAREILSDVENGPFGPFGKLRILQSNDNDMVSPGSRTGRQFISSRDKREQFIVGNDADPSLPSYQWQDGLANHLMARGASRAQGSSSQRTSVLPYRPPLTLLKPEIPEDDNQFNAPYSFNFDDGDFNDSQTGSLALPAVKDTMPSLGPFSLATKRPQDAETIWQALYDRSVPSSGEESEYESDDPADAIGQLSLNEKQQVGYLGKTSGMHLLAKPNRSDNLNNGGIWRLPQSRYWPASLRGRPMIEEDLRLDVEMPPYHIQDQLLELYWTYVQPVLPVLDKGKFIAEYDTMPRDGTKSIAKVPRLLLLSMFTIAARYSDLEPLPQQGTMWEAGCDYLDQAKLILNWTYDSPRPSTCQALILLAYREYGIGAISQAWIYMGMSIRMATDLGMHRDADRWQRSGRVLFSEAEKSSRKRLWHCCILLDRIMAFSMGRPMCIRERDYDATLPSIEDVCVYLFREETEPWPSIPIRGVTARESRSLSTFHATASLSSILALVVDTIYACRSGVNFVVRHVESFKIAAKLDEWYEKMPAHLKYNIYDDMVPFPHVLTLHMMYCCHAASSLSSLVDIYRRTWDLSRANAFSQSHTSVMHVATLTMHLGDQDQARLGLQRCLDALEQMKLVWPSSERAWHLLRGAEIDLSIPRRQAIAPQPQPEHQQPADSILPHLSDKVLPSVPISYPDMHQPIVSLERPAPTPTQSFPSLTTIMGRSASGPPPAMSYFPGCDHWPPESLVFDPPFLNIDHEEAKYNPNTNSNANSNTNQTTTGTSYDASRGSDLYDLPQVERLWGFSEL
ncbi:fungal-specific transcription factor domain-containing protein [Hysterangium stoloniferum]|nr:fungal-specific transcription factor domain-containing protein [Hysterangium stoloniferum]